MLCARNRTAATKITLLAGDKIIKLLLALETMGGDITGALRRIAQVVARKHLSKGDFPDLETLRLDSIYINVLGRRRETLRHCRDPGTDVKTHRRH